MLSDYKYIFVCTLMATKKKKNPAQNVSKSLTPPLPRTIKLTDRCVGPPQAWICLHFLLPCFPTLAVNKGLNMPGCAAAFDISSHISSSSSSPSNVSISQIVVAAGAGLLVSIL